MTKLWDGADAAEILALDRDGDRFRARANQHNFGGGIFGGQLLGQGLMAAAHTVPEGQFAHSLHACFVAAGDIGAPIDYAVSRLRDGRSSSYRRITASQGEQLLCEMFASLSVRRPAGMTHQRAAEAVLPPPEDCPDLADYVHANADRLPDHGVRVYGRWMPIERRPIDPEGSFLGRSETPTRRFWVRLPGASGMREEASLRALIGALSDAWLFSVSYVAHAAQASMNARMASLDHAVWIHDIAPVDEWLLYETESPWSGEGRGVGRGLLYTRDGRLLATAAQEGIVMQGRAWGA